MKLQSCHNCGVLIDTDRFYKLNEFDYNSDSMEFDELFMWEGDDFYQRLKCPVCDYRDQIIE